VKNQIFHIYRDGIPLAASPEAPKHLNRESWLIAATELLRTGLFQEQGATVPVVRVSVGFPGGGSARKRIGEYWHASATTDAMPQIFISPVLGEGLQAIDVLVHELVHACTPGSGHKKPFKVLGAKVGLVGPARSMGAGEELKKRLNTLIDSDLGPYPHAGINLADRKKQTTRMLKCECSECGYTVRTTTKWIETLGAPLCPCSLKQMDIR
jgi:hypothetical protein